MAHRDSEASYRAVFELHPHPMWICDRETRKFTAVNDAALALYGYSREEFLALTLTEIAGQAGASFAGGLQRHLSKEGRELEVCVEGRSLDFQGMPAFLGIVTAGACASERIGALERQLEECTGHLEASNKEIENFSYSVSHDLRAPLRHMDGFSKALLEDYGDVLDAQGKEYLSRICQSAAKMGQLIDDVLRLARVTRSELERQHVNLSVVAQVISLELKHTDPQRPVDFRIEQGLTAQADSRMVRVLLENLIGNAWKFSRTQEKSVIEFGSSARDGETVYYVRDNGVGFDMAYEAKLFTAFQRLHRSDEFEGSGVGLAVAQRIVRRHGGRIWAESVPGQGATFYFTLP